MAEQQGSDIKMPDPMVITRSIIQIAGKSQDLVQTFLQRQVTEGLLNIAESASIGSAFLKMTRRMMSDPGKLAQVQMDLWQDYMNLLHKSTLAFFGRPSPPVVSSEWSNRRCKHDSRQDNGLFDFIKQSYLLTARWLQGVVSEAEGLDAKTKRKLDFYTREFADVLSPGNFPIVNPGIMRATIESGGENLLKGLNNLLDDLQRNKSKLSMRMSDREALKLGEDIACSAGKVIYQNALMQLLHYAPSTPEVYKRPLLIIPPWINKFYLLDLGDNNSFIQWCLDQGLSVFMISWVNPDETLATKDFEDYLLQGPLAALDAIEQATGEHEVNSVGYCLGGTLLACTAAYLAAKGERRITSCTYLTTMLDFQHPGELEVFIAEEQITALDERMDRQDAPNRIAATCNMLRANDLIWSFFINNYLLGKSPFPFDLLLWNADSTRMPARMHSFYLRNMYQNNRLKEAGGIVLAGQAIDLSRVETPAYFLSAIEDHIAPWTSTYAGTQLFAGPTRFVLGGPGHIAGVINPPAANKYCFWVNPETPSCAQDWFENANRNEGSWWQDWLHWVKDYAGDNVFARMPGDGELSVIEDAPGSYVKV